MATICSANRGTGTGALATAPGQIFFNDLLHNPSHSGLTAATHFPYYLIAICSYSRYTAFIGMRGMEVDDIIGAIEELVTNHKPFPSYSSLDISELHSDAGTQLRLLT